MDTSVIIAAAGNSSRMGENKQKMLIGGVPVLARTMLAFESCKSVMEIIISTQKGEEEFVKELAERYNVTKFKTAVAGGKSRQESVLSGLDNISKESRMIAVHDGARPFVSPELIEKAIAGAHFRRSGFRRSCKRHDKNRPRRAYYRHTPKTVSIRDSDPAGI